MAHTPNPLSRTASGPAPLPGPVAPPSGSGSRREAPLLQMQAHWSMRAHRSYLHAANFHWQR